MQYNSSSNK